MAGEYLLEHNPKARLTMYGQELNDESYAICKADMLIKAQDVAKVAKRMRVRGEPQLPPGFRLILQVPILLAAQLATVFCHPEPTVSGFVPQ